MSHTTQCPSCQTKFKVTDAHLALAGGMVRCGRCSHVFHAPSYFESSAPQAESLPPVAVPAPAPSQPARPQAVEDDFELELPDFEPAAAPAASTDHPSPQPAATAAPAPLAEHDEDDFKLPDFDLLREPEPEPQPPATSIGPDFRNAARDAEQDGRQQLAEFQQALADALRPQHNADVPPAPLAANPFEVDAAEEHTPSAPPVSIWTAEPEPDAITTAVIDTPAADSDVPTPWWRNVLLALLAVLLLLLLLGQILFINRTRASAEMPELRPAFEAICDVLGCSVPLPSDRQLIRTEWSELSFIPDHERLIQLNATLKNLAPYPQAFPLMEVTLKNASDQIMMRKVLLPQEYLKPQDYQLGQFNANSELKLQLRMEVIDGKAQGYSLDFFYR
ncbi:DUF3426 domain-containing protein [Vogesella sp. GCM10023246]|uniref:DUF3426 domain-containing protein n=1 Tax=Vogesella oryzagri TaxID=3160864 RepID=A0ABV1M5B0_9NEIS